MESLIKAGAFDSLGEDRAHLLADLEGVLKDVQARRRDEAVGQANLFDLFEAGAAAQSGREKQKPARREPPMPLREKLQYERELLGFYVSGHPMEPFKPLSRAIDSFAGDEWQRMENDEPFRICGVITEVTKKISRRDNRPWAIISLTTLGDVFKVNAFSNCYESCQNRIEEGELVLIEGQAMRRQDDEVQLSAQAVKPLAEAAAGLVREVTFLIEGNGHAEDFIGQLRNELDVHMGKVPVKVGVRLNEREVAMADLASSLEWEVTHERLLPLSRHPAVQDLRLLIPEPKAAPPRWKRKSHRHA